MLFDAFWYFRLDLNLRANYNIKEADDQNIKFYSNQILKYGKY